MGTKKSIKYSPGMQDWLGNLPKDQRVQYSALAGSGRTDDDVPGFISTEAEGPLLNGSLENGNAFVVLGVDRNSTPLSGYGGLGHTQCAAIDIVAGRMGSQAEKTTTVNWATPGEASDETTDNVYCDPGFKTDAARVYISQKSHVDSYFGLANGRGSSDTRFDEPQSCVAMKADAVRIMGRQGIKLITRSDKINSQGGKIDGNSYGIDLIANNSNDPGDINELQPLVKGDNLEQALKILFDAVCDLRSFFDTFVTYQQDLNKQVMTHTHHSPFFGIISSPSPPLVSMGVKNMIDVLTNVTVGVNQHKVALEQGRIDYFEPLGAKYINSRFNNTN